MFLGLLNGESKVTIPYCIFSASFNTQHFTESFQYFALLAETAPADSSLNRLFYNGPAMDLIELHCVKEALKTTDYLKKLCSEALGDENLKGCHFSVNLHIFNLMTAFPNKRSILRDVVDNLFGENGLMNDFLLSTN